MTFCTRHTLAIAYNSVKSTGRGLRLPYGKRTGVDVVDRLNIVAHDKFQEIIDDCNRADSPIRMRQVILDAPRSDEGKISVQVESGVNAILGIGGNAESASLASTGNYPTPPATPPIFISAPEQKVAKEVVDIVREFETRREQIPTSQSLMSAEIQKQIVALVEERIKPAQSALNLNEQQLDETPLDVADIVAKATQVMVQQTIDIPRITVVPTGEVTTGFHPFALDVSQMNLQPTEREMVIQNLHTNELSTMSAGLGIREKRLEDYLVHALVDFEDVDYFAHAELLYDLAGQAVAHFRTKNHSEDEMHNLLTSYRGHIARNIHAQMMQHFWENAAGYEAQVSRGFTSLKPCNYTVTAGQQPHHYRETVAETGKIKQMLFGGFARCLYPLQRFDSDTERRFAIILERDAMKWFKPAKGQFQIYYKLGTEQPEYVPDFVVETDNFILLAETKARTDMDSPEVQAKAASASSWCKHASDYAASVGSKSWKYLLIPHDEINESRMLSDYLRFTVNVL
jgi:type III restriction enzyme